jgi:hypothetical protein
MKKIVFSLLLMALISAGAKLGSARVATTPGALLEGLPDGTAVAIIDFQKIAGSSLWATINAQDKIKSEIDKAQSEMANLGVTLSDVHTVALVFSAGLNSPTVAVSGGFEQNNLLERLRTSPKISLTSEQYKGIDIYKARSVAAPDDSKGPSATKPARTGRTSAAKDGTSFVFYDASTLVAGSSEAVRASVDVKTGARPGLTKNSQLSDALAQNPAAAIRFALTPTSAMTNGLKSGDLPVDFSSIRLVFGTIDVGSGIDLSAALRSDNAENARSISEKLNSLLTMVSGLIGSRTDPRMTSIAEALKTVTITSVDADVKITGNLPMGLLDSLLHSPPKKGQ